MPHVEIPHNRNSVRLFGRATPPRPAIAAPGKSGRNLIFPAAVKARPQLYTCARKAFAKRRSRQNLLNTLSFPHNKNFPPGRGFISKGAHETRGNRLQNALFMRIVRAGTNFFLYRSHYPLPPHPITAPLVAHKHSALARII